MLKDFPTSPEHGRGVLVLRLRMPFDGTLENRNLIMKLRKYKTVLDAQNSLTCVPDMLDAATKLIEARATGIFNVVNPGTMSPYEVMELYKKIVDPAHTFAKLSVSELSTVVKAGRSNCMLSTEKLAEQGISLSPVGEAVTRALKDLATALKNG